MKASIQRAALKRALATLKPIAGGRHSKPILGSVLIRAELASVAVSATDLGCAATVSIAAAVDAAGAVLVPFEVLAKLIRASKAPTVSVESWTDTSVRIDGATVETAPLAEYPAAFEVLEGPARLRAVGFGEALGCVSYAMGSDTTHSNLCAVYLEPTETGYRLAATDGHRLALVDRSGKGTVSLAAPLILPPLWVKLAERLAVGTETVELRVAGNAVELRGERWRLSGRPVEEEFPNYRNVIPARNGAWIRAPREALADALRAVLTMANELEHSVKLLPMCESGLRITASNPDTGEASSELTVEAEGAFPECAFNGRYLLDALEHCGAEHVTLDLASACSPARIDGDCDWHPLAVVMPMRL